MIGAMNKFRFIALWLCALCVALFIVQLVFPSFTEFFLLNSNAWYEPWRFFSAIFLHGGVGHLLYNCFALALFGSILERLVGSRKFLIIFFVTGVIANLISVNFYSSSLGASGAIFGVIGALIVIRPTLVVWAFGLPMPLFVAGIVWVVGDVIGIFVPSGIANIAHLSGLVIGLIFGALYRNWNVSRFKREKIVIDERSIRDWEDRYLR